MYRKRISKALKISILRKRNLRQVLNIFLQIMSIYIYVASSLVEANFWASMSVKVFLLWFGVFFSI